MRTRSRVLTALAAAAVAIGATGAYVNAQSAGSATETLSFVPIAPERILDSRNGIARSTKFQPDEVQVLDVAGLGSVPADAEAVAINLTSTRVEAYGWVTVWPNGETQPPTSSANFEIDQDVPNSGIFGLGDDGALSIYVFGGPADLVVDVTGYFVPGSGGAGSLSSGSSDPTGSCEPGTSYLNLTTGDTFECLAGGTWDQVGNLRGPIGPQGDPGTAISVETTSGAPVTPGTTEGDLAIDESTGDIYRWDGDSWEIVGSTAPPHASGSTADSAAVIDIPLLTVIGDALNDVTVGSVTGLPPGTYDASATVDLAFDSGLLGAGVGVEARCWWSTQPTQIYTISLTAGVEVVGVVLLPGVATGSITVPGTLTGDADLICDAGSTVAVGTDLEVRSVDISAVRVGAEIGTVSLP